MLASIIIIITFFFVWQMEIHGINFRGQSDPVLQQWQLHPLLCWTIDTMIEHPCALQYSWCDKFSLFRGNHKQSYADQLYSVSPCLQVLRFSPFRSFGEKKIGMGSGTRILYNSMLLRGQTQINIGAITIIVIVSSSKSALPIKRVCNSEISTGQWEC